MLLAVGLALAALPLLLALSPLATGLARSRGRLVGVHLDDADALGVLARVDVALLDRWGTVTTGALRVTRVEPVEADHERNLRWFAGALGHAADDPVWRAIARLSTRGRLSRVEHHDGGGLTGSVDRHPVRLGRPEWVGMPAHGPSALAAGAAGDDGGPDPEVGVTVGVEVDGRPIGWITVGDELRPRADEAVDALRRDGVEPVLVSDDTETNTDHLARSAGVTRWHSGILADKRDTVVAEHRSPGRCVALVASTDDAAGADVLLTDREVPAPTAPLVRLDDLDTARVAAAVTLARGAVRARRRSLPAGVVLSLVTAVLAVLTPLPVVGVVAVLACGVVAALAARH